MVSYRDDLALMNGFLRHILDEIQAWRADAEARTAKPLRAPEPSVPNSVLKDGQTFAVFDGPVCKYAARVETAPHPDQAAPQGSAPDALLLARLEAAEAVCKRLRDPVWRSGAPVPGREMAKWVHAKAAHEAQESSHGS